MGGCRRRSKGSRCRGSGIIRQHGEGLSPGVGWQLMTRAYPLTSPPKGPFRSTVCHGSAFQALGIQPESSSRNGNPQEMRSFVRRDSASMPREEFSRCVLLDRDPGVVIPPPGLLRRDQRWTLEIGARPLDELHALTEFYGSGRGSLSSSCSSDPAEESSVGSRSRLSSSVSSSS